MCIDHDSSLSADIHELLSATKMRGSGTRELASVVTVSLLTRVSVVVLVLDD